jgi:hypothetical protein
MKINIILSQNIWFLWAGKLWDEDKYITSRPNKNKTLTIVYLRTGNISQTLLAANNGLTTNCHRSLETHA